MATTGAPWNLPYPIDTDLVIDGAQNFEDLADGVAAGLSEAASNASLLTSGTVAAARLPVLVRQSFRTSTSATETLDFATGNEIVRSTRLGTLTFAGTNYTAGVSKTVVWNGGSSARSVVFPSGWIFVSVKPTSLAANKRGVLSLVSNGTTEGDVTAAWASEA
jgi:hypothetical protein